jgi:metal-responsive CopG/Arc/MetJ family transcriptional regulator
MAKQDFVMVSVRFEGEDLKVLDGLIEAERLSRSDVIRRAVRAYAEQLGVLKPRPKPKRR